MAALAGILSEQVYRPVVVDADGAMRLTDDLSLFNSMESSTEQ